MGIYRALIEEEIPHLDDNNNPDEQLKELMDVVEDQDANQAEQDRAQEAEYAEPGTQADELLGESWMAIYEFEAANAMLMQAIGMHELNEAACGRDVLWEAPDIKGFFKTVKDKVVTFFKKVWSVIQRWAGNLAAVFTSNKKFVEKYGSVMETGHKILSADKSRKDMKGYSFNGMKSGTDNITRKSDDASNDIKALFGSDFLEGKGGTNVSAEEVDEMVNKVRGGFCNKSSVTAADFHKELKDYLYGESEPKDMLMDVAAVKDALSDKKNDRKAVTDFMKESKTQMKKTLDVLNKAEKSFGKDVKDETGAAKTTRLQNQTQYTRAISGMRQILSATQIWRSTMLGAINARARQARRYGMAYVMAANKDKHKGFKESTEYGFLGRLNLV